MLPKGYHPRNLHDQRWVLLELQERIAIRLQLLGVHHKHHHQRRVYRRRQQGLQLQEHNDIQFSRLGETGLHRQLQELSAGVLEGSGQPSQGSRGDCQPTWRDLAPQLRGDLEDVSVKGATKAYRLKKASTWIDISCNAKLLWIRRRA